MVNSDRSLLKRLFGSSSNDQSADDATALREYILGFANQSDAQRAYATTHLGRLVRTVQLTPPGGPEDRILEMGAYMQITPAFKRFRSYGEVRGCYLGPVGKTDEKVTVSQTGESFRCFIDLFDAERDVFPYPDSHFTAIVCAELLEHLSSDPMHLLSEVNRVLRPGGYFILSTPNICSFRSVSAVLRGEHPGLYQQYIRAVDDPRHAREYAPAEISRLLEAAGLKVQQMETGPYAWEPVPVDENVVKLLTERGYATDLRGETIHAVGQKVGPITERYPRWLYD